MGLAANPLPLPAMWIRDSDKVAYTMRPVLNQDCPDACLAWEEAVGYKERRAKMIATLAAPHLEPGEQIQTGFVTLAGTGIFTVPAETFVVTDRAILVLGRGQAQRLPRDFRFGKPTGLYYKFGLDRTYKVHRQWYPEVIAADEALGATHTQDDPAAGEH